MNAPRALFLLCVMAGCGGGNLYPNTDVVEPSGLEPKVATGFQYFSGGLLATGHMEYEGPGELNATFRNYVDAMKGHGWQPLNTDVQPDKATGSLQKDTRKCALTFTHANGRVRAVIIIGQPK